MKILTSIRQMREFREKVNGSVGFIPTMGYLHKGHISLVKIAKKKDDCVIVSIFVNQKQFQPYEDFAAYPRDTEKDLQLLQEAGIDAVFLPDAEEIYPENYETYISVENLSEKLEGKSRPGHFKGVATVVSKLCNIIQPDHAYFGQKDAQQVVVMKKMVWDLQLPVQIIVGETIREKDGLALSSRNVYLSEKERKEAVVLFQSLQLAKGLVDKGENDSDKIKQAMKDLIDTTSGVIDYISVADPKMLDEVQIIEKNVLISLAVSFGKTRLIDNIVVFSV